MSLLFCGVTLKHYAYHTMSKRTQRTTKYMFAVLAQLSENFIFIYLGLNLFTQDVQVFKPLFILVSAVSFLDRFESSGSGPNLIRCRSQSWLLDTLPCSRCRSSSTGSRSIAVSGTKSCPTRTR